MDGVEGSYKAKARGKIPRVEGKDESNAKGVESSKDSNTFGIEHRQRCREDSSLGADRKGEPPRFWTGRIQSWHKL